MATFILTYDLVGTPKNYELLWAELKRLKAHRSLESFWLLKAANTAKEVRDHFAKLIDSNDRLWVSELTTQYDFVRANRGTNDWLRANPPAR